MINRLQKPSPIDYVNYIFGANPADIWEFTINSDKYRLINEWRGDAKLYKNDVLISEEDKPLHLNSKKPFMETEAGGEKIKIYLKAVLSIKIRVEVNGHFIQEAYI